MKKIFAMIITGMLLLTACGGNPQTSDMEHKSVLEEKVLKIGAIPDFDQAQLTQAFDSFAKNLSEVTGLKVEYVPTVDYASLVTAFERGEIDLAWFGGLTGVQAMNRVPESEPIAQREQDAKFKSVFIQQKGLGLKDITDVKGHTFSFGSESSTSGHLMPRFFMKQAGINPETDLQGEPNYSGSHDKTYKLVEAGAFEVGAVNVQYWEKAIAEGKVDLDKVEAFYTTEEYYDYNWTINDVDKKFGAGTKDKIRESILNMKRGDNEVMELLNVDKFIPTQKDNYKSIEEVARELEIIK